VENHTYLICSCRTRDEHNKRRNRFATASVQAGKEIGGWRRNQQAGTREGLQTRAVTPEHREAAAVVGKVEAEEAAAAAKVGRERAAASSSSCLLVSPWEDAQ
jgi:hypothetical protein